MRVLLKGDSMNTAFVLAAMSSFVLGAAPTTPNWNGSYAQAQEEAAGKKPLAVVFGSGQDGWTKIIRSDESKKVLTEQFVCVYVDTSSEAGKKLAGSFAVKNATGLVLSDRSGAVQAYWHDGDLPDASVLRSLRKYGDPQVVVTTTERATVTRVSNYPTSDNVAIPGGTFVNGVYMRSSCPNGNCPYAR
jgi:hypothetical protein